MYILLSEFRKGLRRFEDTRDEPRLWECPQKAEHNPFGAPALRQVVVNYGYPRS